MQVEVAICTWNRASLLERTLSHLQSVVVPAEVSFRIIVVDNNSTDHTQSVLNAKRNGLTLETVVEPRQGHVFARNRAIDMAAGELLLWIDDDVLVDRDWLVGYVEAAADSEFDFWGGPIEPMFLDGKPDWINENWEVLKGCYAERLLGPDPLEFKPQLLPYGANFAIRTEIQKRFRFAESLGRKAHAVIGEDEIQLFRRMLSDRLKGQWCPAAKVKHCIDEARATPDFVRRYFVGQGRRIVSDGTSWGWSPAKLWWHWKTRWILYRLTNQFFKSPTYTAHLIRSALAEGQFLALKELDQ